MKKIIKFLNNKIAVISTISMSTMWCVYLSILLSCIPLMFHQSQDTVLYISNCIQLVALPLIMVGQAIIGKTAENRAKQDHEILLEQFEELKTLHKEIL